MSTIIEHNYTLLNTLSNTSVNVCNFGVYFVGLWLLYEHRHSNGTKQKNTHVPVHKACIEIDPSAIMIWTRIIAESQKHWQRVSITHTQHYCLESDSLMVDITIWSSSLVLDCWNSSYRSGVCWGYSPTWYHVHRRQVWWYSRDGLEDYLSERRPDCVWSDDTRKAGWPASIQLLARQVISCAFNTYC